jgi:hypothetical protein
MTQASTVRYRTPPSWLATQFVMLSIITFLERWYMTRVKAHLSRGGGIVIPADYQKALGLKPGDDVVIVLEGAKCGLSHAVKRSNGPSLWCASLLLKVMR